MRVVVCDDDPMVRSAIRRLSIDAGHEVVGEAESSADALGLLRHLRPDLIVVDLALRSSSGRDVLDAAAAAGVQAIIFSSFIAVEGRPGAEGAPIVVEKPDFIGLGHALERLGFQLREREERRRAERPEPPPSPSFHEAVSSATAGDALVVLEPPGDGDDAPAVRDAVRASLSEADVSDLEGSNIKLLLSRAGEDGIGAVLARLAGASGCDLSRWTCRAVVVRPEETGSDAFLRLKAFSG